MTLTSVFYKATRERWKGMTNGVITLSLILAFAMAVYRDVELNLYENFPDIFRALLDIPKDADMASLTFGAIYGSYGAITIAAIALSIGAASIAREEREGTIGLLLGNPKSRTSILIHKMASMTLIVAGGSAFLWGTGIVLPILLDVSISGMFIGAFMLHMFMMATFFGFLAIAISAWTGNPGVASGVTAGVMFVSFVCAGLFPIISGWESVAKIFPWYYFNGSRPLTNGADWVHLAILFIGIAVLALLAVIGLNRRDLKSQTVGRTLLDRLRDNPITHKAIERFAGSTRVSKVWIKTASEYQGMLFITAALMFSFMGALIGVMYSLMDEILPQLNEQFPETLIAMFGGGDLGTPEGFYQLETFGMMAPIAVMVVTVAIGSRALAGEEERRTMGLLLANPIKRSTVVYHKTAALVLYGFAVGAATFAGVSTGSFLGGLGMSVGNIAATSLLATLIGVAFGTLSLAISAGTGRVKLSVFGTVGLALVTYSLNAYLPLSENLAGYAKWSPFYYYLSSDPLFNGMHWGHGAVLTAFSVVLIMLARALFERRDLRQTG